MNDDTQNTDINAERQPVVKIMDGEVMADSRDVARSFDKMHKDVLRAIRELHCSADFRQRNFAPFVFNDLTGESTSHVLMTKDGFAFLVWGFKGRRAGEFKEKYISAFNAMAAEIERLKLEAALPALLPPAPPSISTHDLRESDDAVKRAVMHYIKREVASPLKGLIEDLDRLKNYTVQRFEVIHERDKAVLGLIRSLPDPREAEQDRIKAQAVRIQEALLLCGVPREQHRPGVSQRLSRNMQTWYLAHGHFCKPLDTQSGAPWVFQRDKVAEWWAASGRAIFERARKPGAVVPFKKQG